ncbi:glycosyltransferase family 4 protein [Thermoflexus sp.]|uniref:glycosyltransferase family 4 protein n=1 Tax=Thermoflexus sp. TaxID=1969742 RepID=UPI0035E3FEB7
MRVVLLSKALVMGAYQRKAEEIARHEDIQLIVLVPPAWRDERGVLPLERAHTRGYTLLVEPIALNGHFHLHFYPHLGRRLRALRPHLLHIEEEPYNLATWHAIRIARALGIRVVFFSWQNLLRRYPPPFCWWEQDVLGSADAAIVGSETAARVWRAKGYTGPIAVIPQVGVDPVVFSPAPERPPRPFTIGYVGRWVPEKGIDLLIRAAAGLPGDWRVRIIGNGPEGPSLRRLAERLGLSERISFEPPSPSTRMPEVYRGLDVLVLPSRTRRNWTEQFGRVLIEAMACGVPVIGSSAGEIPWVIGEAGLVFPEDREDALREALHRLMEDPQLHQALREKGRQRVLERFTHQRIAQDTVAVYRAVASRG